MPPSPTEFRLLACLAAASGDVVRHAGQADILREAVDGAVGWKADNSNVPDGYDWPAYVDRLTALADRF